MTKKLNIFLLTLANIYKKKMSESKEVNAYIVKIKIPEDAEPGNKLKFQTNDSRWYIAIIPESASPGDVLNVNVPPKLVDIKKDQMEIKSVDEDTNEVIISIPININPGDTLQFHDNLDTRFTLKIEQYFKLGDIYKCTIPKESNVLRITPEILKSLEERNKQLNSIFKNENFCQQQQ